MAISRPFLLALIGSVLLAATFLAVRNSRDEGAAGTQAAQPVEEAPAPKPASTLTADEALKAATSGGEVRSGRVDVDVSMTTPEGSFDGNAEAVFQSRGETEIPLFDVDLTMEAQGQKLTAGAVSLGDRAYLTRGDEAFQVPDNVWSELRGARGKLASFEKKGEAAPGVGLLGVDTSGWLRGAKVEDGGTVGGVATTHLTADLNTEELIRDLLPLARQGGATVSLPENFEDQLEKVVKSADVDVYVGNEDRIVRRMRIAVDVEIPRALADTPADAGRGSFELDFRLEGVNKPQRIAAPTNVSEDPVSELGPQAGGLASTMLGAGVIAVDPPPGIANARKAGFRFDQPGGAVPATNNPKRVARAIGANRKVVIFFYNPRALDDQATAEAVRALRRRGGPAVFTDRVENVDKYGEMVQNLGVSQSPSIVIVDRRGQARLIEGYIDADALAQEVADAR